MTTPSDPCRDDSTLRKRAQYWVARLAAKDISETELNRLEAWLADDPRHTRAFARERALWQDLDAVADAMVVPALPQSATSRLPGRPLTRGRLVRAVPVALAASIVAVLFGPSLLLDIRADHRTAAGEVRSLALPDGTNAILDSDSAISVAYDGERRVVHLLEGRAWFDVRHEGRPFLVEAMGGETLDIGTGFEVQRTEGAVEVGVTEGAVRVRAPDHTNGPTLQGGDRVRYTAHGLERLPLRSAAQLAAWRNGELLFDGEPVEAAIEEIARYRGAPVWTIGDFSDASPVSGAFLIERPDEALETVVRMRKLRMTALPGGVVIVRPAPSS